MPKVDRKSAFRIIKMAFAKKRKKLKNSLFSSMQISGKKMDDICSKAGISSDLRPEDLNIDQWKALIDLLV
jgi:16S rRNA A1518/A1519 N6-dimethyltransferase RsmA/KsgA/DIM1 with predicted DNA glycosylase/AP lyase activity